MCVCVCMCLCRGRVAEVVMEEEAQGVTLVAGKSIIYISCR